MPESQASEFDGRAWREGTRFVMRKDATLPRACVKCGIAVKGSRLRKTYYWAPASFLRFIPFPGSLIAVIIALVVRKKITIEIPLCPVHRRRRAIGLVLTFLLCGGGLAVIACGLTWALSPSVSDANNAPTVILIGIALLMIGALCFVFAGRLLTPKEIDDDRATFSGAGAGFLRLLPTSPNLLP